MPSNAETVRVNLGQRSYDVEIGAGNLAAAGRFLTDRCKAAHVVLVTDDHVHRPHAMQAAESLGEQDVEVDVIVVEPGEEAKSLDVAASLWQGLLDLGADRHSVVAAVGGGVIGDLAGFIAATYARGLPFLQIPTSLLAQVDSAVGGKVGINLPEAKNMIGAFHQPLGVLVDVATLATLPDCEYRNGLAEVVKYGAALDAEFFQHLEANAAAIVERRPDVLLQVIARCCRLKGGIVERDERDQGGLRAVLNFGHTFGHAFEALSWRMRDDGRGTGDEESGVGGQESEIANCKLQIANCKLSASNPQSPIPNPQSLAPRPSPHAPLLHGEAVAMGMMCAARLSQRLGRIDAAFTARLRTILETFGLPVDAPRFDPRKVLDAMTHDKKTEHGQLRFVLPNCLGRAELVGDIALTDLRAALENN
jgi:3-dehydroquinate synthetase